jgi:type III secretion protein D
MQQTAAKGGVWRLEIASGPNSGAIVSLAPGRYRLGSDTGDDIVLADRDVVPSHAVLQLTADRADITPLASGIVLQRSTLKTGQPKVLKRDAVVRIGGTRIRVAATEAIQPRQGRTLITACFALLGVTGAAAVYHTAVPVTVGAMEVGSPATSVRPPLELAQAVADFRHYLTGTGLADTVRISASGGVVVASGDIQARDRSAWLDAQKWFDGHLSSHFALRNSVSVAELPDPPELSVAAVSMEPVPNVVTQNGQRFVVGAVLQDGWRIDRITLNDVILRRGGRAVRIAL